MKLLTSILCVAVFACGESKKDKVDKGAREVVAKVPNEVPAEKKEKTPVFYPILGESKSMGSPVAGSLKAPVLIPEKGFGFRHNPNRERRAGYATEEMLNALLFSAHQTVLRLPKAELTLNDLSLEKGGPIPHHGSHQNGRDVDVLFYMRKVEDGEYYPSVGAFFDLKGEGMDFGELSNPDDDVLLAIDLPATWTFVEELLSHQSYANVQRIFVAEHIRNMLLSYAEETKGNEFARKRFADITCQPSYPHDDHFHIRFFCAPEDIKLGCRDSTPIYDWQKRFLKEKGVKAKQAGPKRFRSEVTTHEEAEKKAVKRSGPLHKRVSEWIIKRRKWKEKPHPGRQFCR